MKILKAGDLVKAFGKPLYEKPGYEFDNECIGVVRKIIENTVLVSWPGSGLLVFRYIDLESIDG